MIESQILANDHHTTGYSIDDREILRRGSNLINSTIAEFWSWKRAEIRSASFVQSNFGVRYSRIIKLRTMAMIWSWGPMKGFSLKVNICCLTNFTYLSVSSVPLLCPSANVPAWLLDGWRRLTPQGSITPGRWTAKKALCHLGRRCIDWRRSKSTDSDYFIAPTWVAHHLTFRWGGLVSCWSFCKIEQNRENLVYHLLRQ